LVKNTQIQDRTKVAYRQLISYGLNKAGFLTRENAETPCGFVDVVGFKPNMSQILERLKIMDRVVSTHSWKVLFALRDRNKSQREISRETKIVPPYTRYLLKQLVDYSIVRAIKHSYHDIQYELIRLVPPLGLLLGFIVISQIKDSYDHLLKNKLCLNELYLCVPEKKYKPSILKKSKLFGVYTFDQRGNGVFRKPSTLLNDGNPTIYGQCDYLYFGRHGEKIRNTTRVPSKTNYA
jgi:hypothetical protein